MILSRSPDKHNFATESYIKNRLEQGKSIDDPDVQAVLKIYEKINAEQDAMEKEPEWKENNLEYDLRSTEWILKKARDSDVYAQNLYAAMCNNEFVKAEVWPILTKDHWSCSWRHAGGIIADMLETGDYINWYCSGIRNSYDGGYVPESRVTDEIREDLKRLGWIVLEE